MIEIYCTAWGTWSKGTDSTPSCNNFCLSIQEVHYWTRLVRKSLVICYITVSVVTSRSLKWHLVRFRDFWSENSKKGYLSLPEKSLFQLFGPFFKILSSRKKYNCHFYHRYANCWFWFYWQPMKVSTFVDIWSKVRCVCRTNPRSNAWLLAFTTVFRSLFSAPLVPFRSFFEKLWSLLVPCRDFFLQGSKLSPLPLEETTCAKSAPWIGEVNFFPLNFERGWKFHCFFFQGEVNLVER